MDSSRLYDYQYSHNSEKYHNLNEQISFKIPHYIHPIIRKDKDHILLSIDKKVYFLNDLIVAKF